MTPAEYARLYLDFKDRLVLIAASYLHDLSEAEDIVEESFTKLWEKQEEICISSAPEAYLLSMVRNRCLNHLRSKDTHKKSEQDIAEISVLESSHEEAMFDEEIRQTLLNLLQSLPPLRREIIRLVKFEGMSYLQTAIHLGISPRKVKKEVHNVLSELREIFKTNFN